jgi:SAM-dependent methyltransferase
LTDPIAHWDDVWTDRDPSTTSWFQEEAEPSARLVTSVSTPDDPVVDVGGGLSPLVPHLLAQGYTDLTVVDIARPVVDRVRERHGDAVEAVCADVRTLDLPSPVAVWHDRAVFHFLTDPSDRAAYAARAAALIRPGGHLVIGAFAPDGPTHCSGLPVQQHDADSLAGAFAPHLTLIDHLRHDHTTPGGGIQPFTFAVLRRS